MILYIDTTADMAEIALIEADNIILEQLPVPPAAENFAAVIKNIFRKHKFILSDITKIAVKTGPGLFSRVRVGVVAVNALGYALDIPIVPLKQKNLQFFKLSKMQGQKIVKPNYGGLPHITMSKKRAW
jgi:tRNA A37 threonylcarbamoyladenosine modification protein TsaB